MKKFYKACSIAALVFLGAGLGLTVSGCSIQGADQISQVVKDVTDGKIDVDLNLQDGNFGTFSTEGIKDIWDSFMDGESYNIDDYGTLYSDNYPILTGNVDRYALEDQNIRNLVINAGGCDFAIQNSDNGQFMLEAENVSKLQAYVEDGKLKITTSHSGTISKETMKATKITLFLPEGCTLEEAELELGAGVMRIGEFRGKKAEAKVGAGQIVLEDCRVDLLKLNVGAGDITIKEMQVGTIDTEVGVGNLNLNGSISEDSKLKCAMGNITALLTNKEADLSYELECSMGNISLNGTEYSGLAKTVTLNEGAAKTLKLECSMGNIKINTAD